MIKIKISEISVGKSEQHSARDPEFFIVYRLEAVLNIYIHFIWSSGTLQTTFHT